jgi:hypothetical protein
MSAPKHSPILLYVCMLHLLFCICTCVCVYIFIYTCDYLRYRVNTGDSDSLQCLDEALVPLAFAQAHNNNNSCVCVSLSSQWISGQRLPSNDACCLTLVSVEQMLIFRHQSIKRLDGMAGTAPRKTVHLTLSQGISRLRQATHRRLYMPRQTSLSIRFHTNACS